VRRVLDALEEASLPSAIDPLAFQLIRLGVDPDTMPPLGAYLERELPAILLEARETSLPMSIEDWAERFLLFFDRLVRAQEGGIPGTWDAHYLFAGVGDSTWFVPEKAYITGIVILLAMAVFLVRLFRRRVSEDLEETRRHLWLLPLLLGAVFLFLLGATALIREIQRVRVNDELWRAAPLLFLALKAAVASMMLVAFHLLVTRALRDNLRRVTDRFFPTTALLLLLLDMFLVALVDISLTVYFIVPLVLIIAYELLHSVAARAVLTFLAAAELLLFGVLLFLEPGTSFQRSVLLSSVRGNLLLAAAGAPFVVLVLDLSHGLARPSAALRRTVAGALTGLSLVLIAGALVIPAFGPGRPQPVRVGQLVDADSGENRVLVTSPARLGKITVRSGTIRTDVESTGRRVEVAGADPGSLLRASAQNVAILDRDNVKLVLRVRGRPQRLEIAISSERAFVVYDSAFPVSRELEGRRHVFHIGDFPPSPLELDVTLPEGRSFTVEVTAEYTDPPVPLDVEGEYLAVERRLRYMQRFRVET
jgi:hypothetical protein